MVVLKVHSASFSPLNSCILMGAHVGRPDLARPRPPLTVSDVMRRSS
jgi:hypothetical protein